MALLRAGGLYVIDDMLPQESWPAGHAGKVPRLIAESGDARRPEDRQPRLEQRSGHRCQIRSQIRAIELIAP